MRSRVHDFKDKLGTVEAKVKLVEDIATEKELCRRNGYYADIAKLESSDGDMSAIDRNSAEGTVITSNQGLSERSQTKMDGQPIRHDSDVGACVYHSGNARAQVWVVRRLDSDSQNGRWWGVSQVIRQAQSMSHFHHLLKRSSDSVNGQSSRQNFLNVNGHFSESSEHPLNQGSFIFVNIHDFPLIDGYPFAFVALSQKLGVHSPKGSPVLFPLLVSGSQVGRFFENLFANVHASITASNYSARQSNKKCVGAMTKATESSSVHDFKDKLGTVEAKVKLVEDIATEDKFVCGCCYDFNEVKVELTNLDVHKENGVESEDAVKTTDLNFSLPYELKARNQHLRHNGYVRTRVNQSPNLHLLRRVNRVAQENLDDRCRRFVGGVVSKSFQVHRLHPQSPDNGFAHPIFEHDLKVSRHKPILGKHALDERLSVNIAIHDFSLIDGYPFAFVALSQKLGVHSPKGSPVLFPLLVSGSQVGRFFENLFANVHASITASNYSARQSSKNCERLGAREHENLELSNACTLTRMHADTQFLRGKRVAVIGVGNRMRGDDGVGSVIAERLQELAKGSLLVIDAETVPENYLGVLLDSKPEVALFIDAVDFGGEVGEWALVPLSVLGDKVPTTHTVSLKLLGQILESNGTECLLLAIQPKQIGFGAPMSEEVASVAERIVQMLAQVFGLAVSRPAEMSGEVHGDE
jgi:hydrogenase maturation protease HycI